MKGLLTLIPGDRPFEVFARADRIYLDETGQAAIYDYKTGAPPTLKTIGTFHHQLHIQAAILMEGRFEGLARHTTVEGAYLGLTGSGEGGKGTKADDLPTGIAEHVAKLKALIEAYCRSDTPFTARTRPFKETDVGDYDHLARRGEWEGVDRT